MEERVMPSFSNYAILEDGSVRCLVGSQYNKIGDLLKPVTNKRGYLYYNLRVNGKNQIMRAHQLVALAFIGPRPEGQEVRHLDGNKLNNHFSNLCWGTHRENMGDAALQGSLKGEKSGAAKLTDDLVRQIKIWGIEGKTRKQIADIVGIHNSGISRILTGKIWKHVK